MKVALDTLTKDYQPELNWIDINAPKNPFADSLQHYMHRNKALTEAQISAVKNLLNKPAPATTEVASAGIGRITVAFETALANGVKRPKLRLANYHLVPAKATGMNPGAIYVKQDSTYLGKVVNGKFSGSRDCTMAQQAEIAEVCSDPFKAAVKYGMTSGDCACCGRDLSKHASLDIGVGPICAKKYGWV